MVPRFPVILRLIFPKEEKHQCCCPPTAQICCPGDTKWRTGLEVERTAAFAHRVFTVTFGTLSLFETPFFYLTVKGIGVSPIDYSCETMQHQFKETNAYDICFKFCTI